MNGILVESSQFKRLVSDRVELIAALEHFIACSPCQNNCKKTDITCATRRAEAVLKKVKKNI